MVLTNMVDKFDKRVRSKIMSCIRSSNTKPELMMKSALQGTYLRYQPNVEGNPDFASKRKKIAIFIDGCFWHKCPKCFRPPKSNKKYWRTKIENNVKKDRKTTIMLLEKGWTVLRLWEHEIFSDRKKCVEKVMKILEEKND